MNTWIVLERMRKNEYFEIKEHSERIKIQISREESKGS